MVSGTWCFTVAVMVIILVTRRVAIILGVTMRATRNKNTLDDSNKTTY